MSETASVGTTAPSTAAPAASTSQNSVTSGQQSSSGTSQSQPSFGNPNGQAQGGANQTQEQAKVQARELGEADLDAIVTFKVGGEIQKATVRELQKAHGLDKVAQRKMTEAAEREKSYKREVQKSQAIMQAIEAQDDQAFKALTGKDLSDYAENLLAKKYEMMQMSPEQRKLLEVEARLQKYEAQETGSKREILDALKEVVGEDIPKELEQWPKEKLQMALEQKRQEYQTNQAALQNEFIGAWKESGLPTHKHFGAQMAFLMMSHQKRTGEPLQATEAAARVKTDFVSHVKEIVSQMDASAIQELLGKDVMEKVRAHDVERVTGKAASNLGQNRPANAVSESNQKKYLNQMDWRKAMGLS